jgi:hypothetical protein
MIKRIAAAALCVVLLSATDAGTVATAKILDYERGYIFFTSGDGFRVSPNVQIVQYGSDRPAASQPHVRQYARVTFDASGLVTKIELSDSKLPQEGDLSAVHRFAVALSTPAPNPDLANPPKTLCQVQGGKLVTVAINVEVPPSTKITDNVYMTTDQSGWNPQAYHLDRVDALHYRTTLRLLSGTVLKYLFDRGSASSIQVAESGIEQPPQTLCVGDAPLAVGSRVFRWADETSSGTLPVPQTMPTPFNPAPFPNLPSGQTPPPALSK